MFSFIKNISFTYVSPSSHLFFNNRGAKETSSQEVFHQISNVAKKHINSRFPIANNNISQDLDAFSFIISTNDMTPTKKNAIRKYLMSFGGLAPSRCNFPKTPVASHSKDGMFGCCNNECQHLPQFLQGKEILVIDVPVKIAIHASCKASLINSLMKKGYYFKPAGNKSGLCFDANAAAGKPPFSELIDSILDTCFVAPRECGQKDSLWCVHVADMGMRYPLPDEKAIDALLNTSIDLRKMGIHFEILQLDIAFVVKLPPNQLIQASCHRAPDLDLSSLLQKTEINVYPLHDLPDYHNGKIRKGDLKGTLQVKKNNWGEEFAEIDLTDGLNNDDITKFYSYSGFVDGKEIVEEILVDRSTVYSIKAYSSISHVQLQQRNKFPMSLNAMYGVGQRSIETIQTMLHNAKNVLEHSFNVVKSNGIGFRIEVSLRPPIMDPLRISGHFNDFMLIACAAVKEFCSKKYKPELVFLNTKVVETNALKLLSEAVSMVRFRQQLPFNKVYPDIRVTDWLRYQLSLILITMGISPAFEVKYINNWIEDSGRFDPFRHVIPRIRIIDPTMNIKNIMLDLLSRKLKEVGFTKRGTTSLLGFVRMAPEMDCREFFMSLPFHDKHLLANTLWSDIVPSMSKILSSDPRLKSRSKATREDSLKSSDQIRDDEYSFEHVEDYSSCWWEEYLENRESSIEHPSENPPLPQHPIALGILALVKVSSQWNPKQVGFLSILCNYIQRCHKCSGLGLSNVTDTGTSNLLSSCSKGSALSSKELKHICIHLIGSIASNRNQSVSAYQEMLCKKYQFPWTGNEMLEESPWKKKRRNKLLNLSLCSDIAICIKTSPNALTYFRIAENAAVEIENQIRIFSIISNWTLTSSSDYPNLYVLLSKMLNANGEIGLRKNLYSAMNRGNACSCILCEIGVRSNFFKLSNNLNELEERYSFLTLPDASTLVSLSKSKHVVPEVTIAMTSLAYGCNILFINKKTNKTYFFKNTDGYTVEYCQNGSEVVSLKQSLKISLNTQGLFQSFDIKPKTAEENENHQFNPKSMPSSNFNRRELCVGMTGRILRNITLLSIPNRKRVKGSQGLYTSLRKILEKLDDDYLDKENNKEDPLQILSFLEELSVSTCNSFKLDGLHANVLENCRQLGYPIKVLLQFISTTGLENLDHQVLCPLMCLRYKNLVLCVFQYKLQQKKTYLYATNHQTEKVECHSYLGYSRFIDRQQTLYIYCSEKKSEPFLPQVISVNSKTHNHWHHSQSTIGKYSFLSLGVFHRYARILSSVLQIDTIRKISDTEGYHFCPNYPQLTIIPIEVIGKSNKMRFLSHNGILSVAVMMIFSRQTIEEAGWDVCIVHHPHQDDRQVMKQVKLIMRGAPESANYHLHMVKGLDIESCESSFYNLFYIFMGVKCMVYKSFASSMMHLKNETQTRLKIQKWVHFVMKYRKLPQTTWVDSTIHNLHLESSPDNDSQLISKEQKRMLKSYRKRDRFGKNDWCNHKKIRVYEPTKEDSSCKILGILNEGNQCYMIVIMQLLFGMKSFQAYILENDKNTLNVSSADQSVFKATSKLFHTMSKSKSPTSLTRFKKELLTNSCFNEFDNDFQHDPHQFMITILHFLCKVNSSSKVNTRVEFLHFQSIMTTCVQCLKCQVTSLNNEDKSMVLELPISGHTLEECISSFFQKEKLTGWNCNNCHMSQSCHKSIHLQKRDILILTLKRYNSRGQKITSLVHFPTERLEVFIHSYTERHLDQQTSYRLYGVVNHHGESTENGHYTVCLRQQETWYKFNDDVVTEINRDDIVSNDAYILLYCITSKYNKLIEP